MTTQYVFSEEEVRTVYRVIAERRDMRHFTPEPVAPNILERLLRAGHHAPSVGLMQPWRFIRITDNAIRESMHTLVNDERLLTAQALGERENEFMRLKVEGIKQCGELLVVTLCDRRDEYVFGRRTLPEMDLASVACAIQNIWLAARAEGLGMGWVSLFDPDRLRALLNIPAGAKPVAILCIGHVPEFYAQPMLVQEKWAEEQPLEALVMENSWQA